MRFRVSKDKKAITRYDIKASFVNGLKPESSQYRRFDSKLLGFYVTVYPSGAKSYGVNYTDKHGRKTRFTIGKHGTLTTDEARKAAKKRLAEIVVNDANPQQQRQKDRNELTVSELFAEYFLSEQFREKAPLTQRGDQGRFGNHILPLIGRLRLSEVNAEKVRKMRREIAEGKTATSSVKGGEGTARMAVRLLSAVYGWACKNVEGFAIDNPCRGVNLGRDGERTAILKDAEEYRRLFEALDHLTATRQVTENAADCIRLLALTGARRSEVCAIRWRNIDAERGAIVLAPTEHKTGRKTGAKKTILLPAPALAIVAKRERGQPDDYVFRGEQGSGHTWLNSKIWVRIRREANLPDGITNHALRHSFATMLAVQGAEAAQLMKALGHAQISTTVRYINTAEDAQRRFLEQHTAGISAALEGRTELADVVNIGQGKK